MNRTLEPQHDIDISGELRIEEHFGRLYVVRRKCLVPVCDIEEGELIIAEIESLEAATH